MSTPEIINLFSDDVAETLGLFTTKNSREAIKRTLDNQRIFIEHTLSSHNNDDITENTVERRVYDMKDIEKILDISKTAAYALIKQAPFRVVRIGNAIRISKVDFDRWLDDSEQRRD